MRPVPVPRSISRSTLRVADRGENGRFHGLLGDVQRAQQVPAFGHLGEIGGRLPTCWRRAPLRAARGRAACSGSSGDRRPISQRARSPPAPPAARPIIGPGALGIAMHQPGIGEKLQMPRHARLALAENFGQVLDRLLAIGKQRQQPQPGDFPGRPQHLNQIRSSAQISLTRYKDIFICVVDQRLVGSVQQLPTGVCPRVSRVDGFRRGFGRRG